MVLPRNVRPACRGHTACAYDLHGTTWEGNVKTTGSSRQQRMWHLLAHAAPSYPYTWRSERQCAWNEVALYSESATNALAYPTPVACTLSNQTAASETAAPAERRARPGWASCRRSGMYTQPARPPTAASCPTSGPSSDRCLRAQLSRCRVMQIPGVGRLEPGLFEFAACRRSSAEQSQDVADRCESGTPLQHQHCPTVSQKSQGLLQGLLQDSTTLAKCQRQAWLQFCAKVSSSAEAHW